MTEDPIEIVQNIQEAASLSIKRLGDVASWMDTSADIVAEMVAKLNGLDFQPLHDLVQKDRVELNPFPELGVSVVDNGNYGEALKLRMKGYVDKIAKSDIRRVMMFLNKRQILTDEFHKYVIGKNLLLDLDTMWSIFRTTTVAERTEYMEKVSPFVYAWHFDDMHRNSVDEIQKAVEFMRDFTDRPIYGTINADDFRTVLDPTTGKPVIDPRTGKPKKEPVDVQGYKDAGVLITRQFFRHTEPTSVLEGWLNPEKNGNRIIDGVNLEAYQEGVITSADEFEDMFLRCLEHDVEYLSAYAVVNGQGWLMWEKSPPLWNAVNRAARYLRMLKI